MGIIIGNSKIKNKNILIPFFDGVTSLAQILIFFLLGLLSFPHRMPQIILPALAIVVILTLVARPIAVFAIMLPFKSSIKQCLLVSWAGLRGAASSVFAIMVISSGANISYDLFHIMGYFCQSCIQALLSENTIFYTLIYVLFVSSLSMISSFFE